MTSTATLAQADRQEIEGLAPHAASAGLRNASKRFGGTIALENASFDLLPGKVLALLGENGAGKSTCVKLLAGVYRPDSGAVLVDNAPVEHWTPVEAQRRGVAVMHQHPGLFGDLTVFENIFIGHTPSDRFGSLDYERMRAETRNLLEVVGLSCRPDQRLQQLRTSEQQLVEIVRALSVNAKVLIMDEPTAALSQREVDRLFAVGGRRLPRTVPSLPTRAEPCRAQGSNLADHRYATARYDRDDDARRGRPEASRL